MFFLINKNPRNAKEDRLAVDSVFLQAKCVVLSKVLLSKPLSTFHDFTWTCPGFLWMCLRLFIIFLLVLGVILSYLYLTEN